MSPTPCRAPTRSVRRETAVCALSARSPGVYDEMLAAPGEPRPHWQPLIARWLAASGRAEMRRGAGSRRGGLHPRERRHLQRLRRPARHGTGRGSSTPLPLLVASADWSRSGDGLSQRARLLEPVLADLYGPQRLLRDGLLPPELVFANPASCAPVTASRCRGGRCLHALRRRPRARRRRPLPGARRPHRRRRRAPATRSRTASSSRACCPSSSATAACSASPAFFQRLRDTLRAGAAHRDNPRIVLLTPGPYNETYFEHAYLARYLGFTLVEGARPHRARRARLPEDARRAAAGRRDPAPRSTTTSATRSSCAADSSLGVAGPGAGGARAATSSSPTRSGSGLVETPALLPFLPGLCRQLLGEELRSAVGRRPGGAATPARRSDVLEHLESWSSSRPSRGARPARSSASARDGAGATACARVGPAASLRRRRSRSTLSTAPAWTSDGLQPRHASCCALLRRPRAATATPSCRAASPASPPRRTLVVSMQRGGGSKDTWVLSEESVPNGSACCQRPERACICAARQRPAEPRRRQPLLARPLRRARRGHRARCCAAS